MSWSELMNQIARERVGGLLFFFFFFRGDGACRDG